MTNTVYVIIAASVGTASVIGLAVASVVVVCRARRGGGRGRRMDHYDLSEDTKVCCLKTTTVENVRDPIPYLLQNST